MKSLLSFTLILFVGKAMADPAPPKPEEIIKRAIDARGGKDVLQRYAMAHLIGEGTRYKDDKKTTVKIERWNAPPHRQRTVFVETERGRTTTTIVVLDKDRAWIKHEGQPTEAVGAVDLADLKAQAGTGQYTLLFPLFEDPEIKMSMSADQVKDGELCWCVLVRRKGMPDTTLAFSKKTYLLKAEYHTTKDEDGEQLIEYLYSDYRKIDGGLVAYQQETYEDSRIVARFETKKLTPIKHLDEKLFAKPE